MPILKGKVGRENLSDRVYSIIRSALMDGQFETGQRLKISEISNELGVSITPVREAIFRLVSEEALEMKAATAVHVPTRTSSDLRQIKAIRLFLEGMAAEAAAQKISQKALDHLTSLQTAFLDVMVVDVKKASELNRKFHFALAEASEMTVVMHGIETMWLMLGPTLNDFHRIMQNERKFSGTHKHEAVLEALRNKDGEAAKCAIQEDIEWGDVVISWVEEREHAEAN